jgi:hypothetical protein
MALIQPVRKLTSGTHRRERGDRRSEVRSQKSEVRSLCSVLCPLSSVLCVLCALGGKNSRRRIVYLGLSVGLAILLSGQMSRAALKAGKSLTAEDAKTAGQKSEVRSQKSVLCPLSSVFCPLRTPGSLR